MRILVAGAGATGGYYGARLAHAGRDVTFLVRPARAGQLRNGGLDVISPNGDVRIEPQVVTVSELSGPYDLVLFAVKAFGLNAAIGDIARAVGPQTMILPVLNGMHHIDALVARFGDRAVIGGVCIISALLDEFGRVVQLTAPDELSFGERSGGESARIAALEATLRNAGFAVRASSRITHEMWEKWVLLASLCAITCLMRGTVGDVVAAPGGSGFASAVIDECAATAAAHGNRPREEFLLRVRTTLTTAGSALTPSTYRDLVAGHDVEADQILGDLLVRAIASGVAVPLLAAAYTHMKVYQARRSSEAS